MRTVAAAMPLAFAASADADTLLHSVTAYTSTADRGIEKFSSLVFDDRGRIVATGGDELIAEYADARHIDGGQRFVLPGLVDAHAHVYRQGILHTQLNLTGTSSLEDALSRIGEYDESVPGSDWIKGRGWNQVLWPVSEFPTADDIDTVVRHRPVWLERIDGHAGWANSKALEIAGIDDDTPDPVGGRIHRDANGRATGIFIDRAMALVEEEIPPPSRDDYRNGFLAAFTHLTSLGLTSVHDAGIGLIEAETYISMALDGQMTMRVYAMIAGAGENLDALAKPILALADDRLSVAAVKLYADGALGSRGAALIEPYDDDIENRGLRFWSDRELTDRVAKSNGMGFQVGIHAIGDLANQQALDTFEKAQGGRSSDLRNRIEHAQVVRPDDIPRFAQLGVIAAMQATHATSDMNMAEDRIGPERIKGAYAWRKMLDSGAVIANGSDFPVELPNPMHGLYASVTRMSRDGLPERGWYPAETMTRAEALHSFTWAGAYAARQEDRLGSLEPGKWADFIVVDRDFFEIPASEIDDIRVIQTWIGGELVYERCANEESQNDC